MSAQSWRPFSALGPDRLCFGSDMPFSLMHVQLAKYNALLRDHDAAARQQIMGGNFARLVGLPAY